MSDSNARLAIIEANRRRYEELKAAGQKQTPLALPDRTKLDGAPISLDAIIIKDVIPEGGYWTVGMSPNQTLRLVNLTGLSSVAMIAWNRNDPSDRLNYPDTIKGQWSAIIQKGRVLLSDMGRVLMSVTEDTSFLHDALCGSSTSFTNAKKYGPRALPNSADNFIKAAAKNGLTERDVPPCISFFAPVSVDDAGRLKWRDGVMRSGDFVDLRAEMPLLVTLSNCPHPLNPASTYTAGPVEVTVFKSPIEASDFMRRATIENKRAFENTDQYLATRDALS